MTTRGRAERTPVRSVRADALVTRLRKGAARAGRVLQGLTEDEWMRVLYPGPPAWTVRDMAAHLLSAEDGLRRLGQDIASGGAGAPPGLDHDDLNAAEQGRLAAIQPAQLLSDVVASREATIVWVETLADEELDQVGRHPALGEITVESHVNVIYGHALMHLRDLQRAPAARA